MCWISCQQPKAIKAAKDIDVYKVVREPRDGLFLSLYMCFTYHSGQTYYNNNDLIVTYNSKNNVYIINQGFHSYASLIRAVETVAHHYMVCLLHCIIPKGTIYYVNDDEEVVSESIKICSVIKN